jgi:hypothetical protein
MCLRCSQVLSAIFSITFAAIALAVAFSALTLAQTLPKSRSAQSPVDPGSMNSGVYRNLTFAFSCKVPDGWVLRTEQMNSQSGQGGDRSGDQGKSSRVQDAGKARVLLAAFSRPPEARAEDVNASILIAAESLAAYPGLKDAAQYFGPVTEVAEAQGFEVAEDPYEFAVGSKTLVRGDFTKNVGSRVMRQSTLVMLSRGYAVSFTFIGGTEDEVEELVGNLSFGSAQKAVK